MLSKPHDRCTGVLWTDYLVEGEALTKMCEVNCLLVVTELVVSGVVTMREEKYYKKTPEHNAVTTITTLNYIFHLTPLWQCHQS